MSEPKREIGKTSSARFNFGRLLNPTDMALAERKKENPKNYSYCRTEIKGEVPTAEELLTININRGNGQDLGLRLSAGLRLLGGMNSEVMRFDPVANNLEMMVSSQNSGMPNVSRLVVTAEGLAFVVKSKDYDGGGRLSDGRFDYSRLTRSEFQNKSGEQEVTITDDKGNLVEVVVERFAIFSGSPNSQTSMVSRIINGEYTARRMERKGLSVEKMNGLMDVGSVLGDGRLANRLGPFLMGDGRLAMVGVKRDSGFRVTELLIIDEEGAISVSGISNEVPSYRDDNGELNLTGIPDLLGKVVSGEMYCQKAPARMMTGESGQPLMGNMWVQMRTR